MAPAMLGDGIVHSPTGAAALAHGAVEPGSDADALPAATASDSDGAVGPAVGPPLAIIMRMPPSAAVVSPACIASQRHQRGLVSDSSLHADGSGALSSFGWRCMRCSDRCRRLPPRHCPRVSRVPGSRLCSDDHHPHGVAIRCLSCPQFVSVTGAVKLYKFCREGSRPPKGIIYDLSRFLSTNLGTKSHIRHCQHLQLRLLVNAPQPAAAVVRAPPPPRLPLCHADLMRRAFGKLVDIAPPRWSGSVPSTGAAPGSKKRRASSCKKASPQSTTPSSLQTWMRGLPLSLEAVDRHSAC